MWLSGEGKGGQGHDFGPFNTLKRATIAGFGIFRKEEGDERALSNVEGPTGAAGDIVFGHILGTHKDHLGRLPLDLLQISVAVCVGILPCSGVNLPVRFGHGVHLRVSIREFIDAVGKFGHKVGPYDCSAAFKVARAVSVVKGDGWPIRSRYTSR